MNTRRNLLLFSLISLATGVRSGPLFIPGPDGPQNGSPGAESIGPVRPGAKPARMPLPPAPAAPMPGKSPVDRSGRVTWQDGGSSLPKVLISGAEGIESETYVAGQAPAAIDAPFQSLRQLARPPVAAQFEGGEILPPESALPPLLARLGNGEIAVKPLGSFAIPPGSPVRLTLEAAPGMNQALILASRPEGRLLTLHFTDARSGTLLARAMFPSGGKPISLGFEIANAAAIDLILSGEADQTAPFECQVYVGSAPAKPNKTVPNPEQKAKTPAL